MLVDGKHDYGLSWIDQDALYEEVKAIFAKSLGLAKPNKNLPPDPFTIVAQTMVTNTALEVGLAFESQRKVNKTISNAVGSMHQRILGLAPNWENLGQTGGLVDIRTVHGYEHPRFGKPVVAEVKNRFNTIKGENKPAEWDKIKSATKVVGAQGYLFEITPEKPERYDHPWTPSHRTADEAVRVCDGATAYEMVFGHASALKELYMALPDIFLDIKDANGLTVDAPMPSSAHMEELYAAVFPD